MKRNNNNQPSPGDQAEIKTNCEPVHMVHFFRDIEINVLRLENKILNDQIDNELDKYCSLEEEHDELEIEFSKLESSFKAQSEIIKKQRKQLREMKRRLMELDKCKVLAMMAEEVCLGSVDKTALDYLKKLRDVRQEIYIPALKESEEKLK